MVSLTFFKSLLINKLNVAGPMVYGISYCPLNQLELLKSLECADSKQLTEEQRNEIFDNLNRKGDGSLGWAVEVISPNDISMSMLRRSKRSLNEVSMDSAIDLIRKAIDLGVNIAEVYVDTVGPADKYQAKLLEIFPNFKIIVAKKADSTYPIVSAASICAKVIRDHALKAWQFPEGITLTHTEFGSGYPGDPKTKTFLREYADPVFGYPRLVRFSWQTAVTAMEKQTVDVEFEEPEDEKVSKKLGSIKTFFKADDERHERHEFFKDRFLENCTEII